MKGSFNAPFFYAELHPEIDRKINLKLARFLRRWQLGVACLDTRAPLRGADKHTPKT